MHNRAYGLLHSPLISWGLTVPSLQKPVVHSLALPYVFLFIGVRGLHIISHQEVRGKIIVAMQHSSLEEKGLADPLMGPESQ